MWKEKKIDAIRRNIVFHGNAENPCKQRVLDIWWNKSKLVVALCGGKRWIKNPGINNIRRNGKAENVPGRLMLAVFLFLSFPYLADREGRSGFCKKVFQCIFEEFHGTFAGGLWIFMLDLIADTVWRCVFQFTDKKRPVMGKLQDHRLWCDHPVSRFFPETVQKCDGICRNVRSGSGGKPAVMPDMIIVIPA